MIFQVESNVASARKKIDTIGRKAKEQFRNWKRVLSGALNDPQLILALSILFCLYVILTAFNSIVTDTSKRDNASTCECPIFHRVVYRSVLFIGIFTWLVGFVIISIWDAYKFWRFEDRAKHPEEYQAKVSKSSEMQERAKSFLERTINSVETGAQAVMKIPAKSMLNKALDVIEDGVDNLRVIDDGIEQFKENPIDAILSKTMESVTDVVSCKLEDGNAKTDDDDDDESKPSMLQKAAELIDMARQDSILGKLVKPIDEKVEAAAQTTAGSKLTDLVTNGAKLAQENPADLVLTKAMVVVDDNTEPNRASTILAKSVEFVAAVKENPNEALLAASVGVADNILSSKLQNSDRTEQKATGSLLSAALDLAEAGMQAAREDPAELLSSRAMELAVSAVELSLTASSMIDEASELVTTVTKSPTETVKDIEGAKVSNEGPSDSSLQGMLEDAIQSVPLAKDRVRMLHEADVLADTDVTAAKSVMSGSMKNMQLVDFEKSSPKKKPTAKGKLASQTRTLSTEDRKTLQHIKHYENFLWLEFYKVYSVGATAEDESHTLPSFVDVLGGDDREGTSDECNKESETQPLLVQSSYNGATELPTIVVEADFSDEDSDLEECNQNERAATRSSKNTRSDPKLKETSLITSATKVANQQSSITKDKDEAKHKSLSKNTKAPSVATAKHNAKSPTSDLTSGSDDDDEEKSFLRSWVDLRPEGLYTDMHEQTNIVMKVADVTCASIGFFLYPILVVLRLCAQLALVPLLMFQVIGSYIWICVTNNVYCRTTENQYRLGLDKAAVGFIFYCCILLAILSTSMLRWFPYSKRARSSGVNCIM